MEIVHFKAYYPRITTNKLVIIMKPIGKICTYFKGDVNGFEKNIVLK